jgi:hypothetical protein
MFAGGNRCFEAMLRPQFRDQKIANRILAAPVAAR